MLLLIFQSSGAVAPPVADEPAAGGGSSKRRRQRRLVPRYQYVPPEDLAPTVIAEPEPPKRKPRILRAPAPVPYDEEEDLIWLLAA